MTFRSAYLLAALAMAKVNPAASSQPCLAACEIVNGEKQCKLIVRRNRFAGELGYFTFEGKDGDCGKTNPTLGKCIETRVFGFVWRKVAVVPWLPPCFGENIS